MDESAAYERFVRERLPELHERDRFVCSECVLLIVQQWMGWSHDAIPAIATGFGGGIGRAAHICGALSGAIMVLGLLSGRRLAGDNRAKKQACVWSRRYLESFARQHGSIVCRDIARVDFDRPEDVERWLREGGFERCTGVILKALLQLEPFFAYTEDIHGE